MAGGVIEPKVSFLAQPRTRTPGHDLPNTKGRFLASRLFDLAPQAIAAAAASTQPLHRPAWPLPEPLLPV
ncbi:MAG: hypothetical protein H7Z19_16600 [Chitinophagaceae bacterium]|nr:hypothetical protein [Rubrivivax sp.]